MVAKEEDLRGVETMFRDECVVMVDIFLKDRLECATRKIAAGLGLQKVRAACDEVLNVVKFRRVWVRRESMLYNSNSEDYFLDLSHVKTR
jgi:hypothetical protein